MFRAGLVLEGGGMRGIFTAGVLDFFLEKQVEFESCIGVSAGACHACSYLSKQYGRAFRISVDYLEDKRYCSAYSWLTTGDLFGVKMVYDTIPNELSPYDYDTFANMETRFYAAATNCRTGKAEYLPVREMREDLIAIRASSSLPALSRMVPIGEELYLDGGVSDPIPIAASIDMGNRKNVVVLTRHDGYRKKPNKMMPILKKRYKNWPNLIRRMQYRDIHYNETLDFLRGQEAAGTAFVIRPEAPLELGRVEKNKKKLKSVYYQGYLAARARYGAMLQFLNEGVETGPGEGSGILRIDRG